MLNEKKDNRRVRYTKMVLRESLIELLKTKPINRITVTDICMHADLNRGTFYNYYCDAYDLLAQIEDGMYNDLLKTAKRFEENGVPGELTMDVLSSIEKNREVCNVLFNINPDKAFMNRLLELMRTYAFNYWEANNVHNLTPEQLDILYSFFSNGAIGVICKWIAGDWDVSKEYIGKTILSLGLMGAPYFSNDQSASTPGIRIKSE